MSAKTLPAALTTVAITWLNDFETALAQKNADAAANLFAPDGHWRDLVAFTWHIRTFSGRDAIRSMLRERLPSVRPYNFRIADKRTAPRVVKRAGVESIEAIIAFETETGQASGVLRLVPSKDDPKKHVAWVMLTSLDEIKGHEERIGKRRPRGEEWSGGFGGDNWMDVRKKQIAYTDREPAVVVIGGSQCGLGIAACLNQLGVDTLVIDKHARVGDAWRKRYHNLTLHNEVYVDHMPYLPFPPNYPVYIPRDKIANWLEFYADTMELNVWTGTEFTGGSYDAKADRWALKVRRADGSERNLQPRHVIFATGVSAIPIKPDLPGLDTFAGEVLHSSQFMSGAKWKGGKAIVLGTGNSGHDVAHDLHESGVHTTMVQRSSTLIVSLKEAQRVYELYQEGTPTEDCDLIATASPYPVLVQGYKIAASAMRDGDKKLLDGLQKRGFRLDFGPPDDTGYQMKYLRRGGGYYFNVGCSDLIVDGKIGLLHHRDIERVMPKGVKMKDGSIVEADVIVAATGYKNQQDVVRHFLGDRIADRIGQVWGFDKGGELRNMWCRTSQPGLWFVGGGLPQVRIYSKYLAQQIKACEVGLLDRHLDADVPAPMVQAA
ncbi:MAG: NAD(P)/FAD-dependent oxidoreductase [Hyphomicrobiaceae bacterium]